ncbi:hypothetical protein ACOSQ2_013536 [Xanthoceras sorbifolium]
MAARDQQIQDAHIIDINVDSIQATQNEPPNDIQIDISTPRNSPSIQLLSDGNRKLYRSISVNLYKAASKGDFKDAERFLREDRQMLRASITEGEKTVLHVATEAKQTAFVEELVNLMEPEDLILQDIKHNTAFCFAAAAGNIQIAKIMLTKNASLPKIRGCKGLTPLYMAVMFRKSDMASFLYYQTKEILTAKDRTALFFVTVRNDLYDIALKLLEDDKDLAVARDQNHETALHILARKPLASDCRSLGLLKRLFNSVPGMKFNIQDTYMISTQARQLVKSLWEEILERDPLEVKELIREPSQLLFDAAKLGNFEFLTELICSYPDLLDYELDENNRSIFHIAVLHRHANIFNLIYEIDFNKDLFATFEDKDKNNILHLAAKLPHPSRISIVSGAALQMQRELLWFEEVEKIVQPSFRDKKNSEGKTPRELFTIEHENLRRNGELWLKETAKSCMIIATLIATVVFTAAFSVPGGNDNNKGIPIHLKKTLFQVFATSDAIALSCSSISILMFLSILTSRYAENDFLKSLPLKLMVGLSALFMSIITMMVAFSATFFLAYHDRLNWVTMLTTVLAFVPVTLFVLLHYPLLRDIFHSTYCSRFLFKPSKFMLG